LPAAGHVADPALPASARLRPSGLSSGWGATQAPRPPPLTFTADERSSHGAPRVRLPFGPARAFRQPSLPHILRSQRCFAHPFANLARPRWSPRPTSLRSPTPRPAPANAFASLFAAARSSRSISPTLRAWRRREFATVRPNQPRSPAPLHAIPHRRSLRLQFAAWQQATKDGRQCDSDRHDSRPYPQLLHPERLAPTS